MNALYDTVCSVVIGGIVLVMLLGFNTNILENGWSQITKVMVQSNLTEVTNDVEYEFRKIGYRVAGSPDSAIIYADTNKIKFKSDIDNNGVVDTLTYYFNPSSVSGNANTNTHILYRTLNSSTQLINLGLTRFRVSYYSSNNGKDTLLTTNPISLPSRIKSIKVALNVESREPYKETTMQYLKFNPGVYWERTFKPKNLR